MNNHVHFTKYLDYVLAARYDQMENNYKFPMDEFVKSGLTWVVSKTTIEYKRSLVMGDVALVETGIHSYSGSNCIVDFVIYNKKTNENCCKRRFFLHSYLNHNRPTGKTYRRHYLPLLSLNKKKAAPFETASSQLIVLIVNLF
jgi:thioesterase-3